MKLSPDFDPVALNGFLFIHGPTAEPLDVSRQRLERAITEDGIFDTIGAAAVWYAYRHHPELSKPVETAAG